MRANRGFTLLEMMIVLTVVAIVGALVVWQGMSARQAADLAGGTYDLALKISGLKARAMADARDYLLVVADTDDPVACAQQRTRCGRVLVLREPDAGFAVAIAGFDPEPPIVGGDWDDSSDFLPRNSRFELASTWRAPAPFGAVQAWDPAIRATCAGGRACFALRFQADGEVRPVYPAGVPAPEPAGFAFVLAPVDAPSGAAERRALFVSFPGGIVKTAAGTL